MSSSTTVTVTSTTSTSGTSTATSTSTTNAALFHVSTSTVTSHTVSFHKADLATVAVSINGIDAAALKEDKVAASVVANAVGRGVMAGASDAFDGDGPHHHTGLLLQGARRLQARALQDSVAVGVEMDLAPPGSMTPAALWSGLVLGADGLGKAVVTSILAVPNLEQVVPITGPISATASVTMNQAAVDEVLSAVDTLRNKTFGKLADIEGNLSLPLPGVGVLFASKLEEVSPSVSTGPFEIALPSSFISKFSNIEDDVGIAFSALAVDASMVEQMGGLAAVALDLNSMSSGGKVSVNGLVEPVEIKLPVVVNHTGSISCAYWDEDEAQWSTRGVRISTKTTPGGPLVCETTHFSLFGAVLKGAIATVLCANFNIFTWENTQEVLEGKWLQSFGGLIFFGLMGTLLFVFGNAAALDYHRGKREHWNDEFFLVSSAAPTVVDAPAEDDAPDEEKSWLSKRKAAALGCCAAGVGCTTSDACREAVDDICSSWFEYFSEVRELFESMCSGCGGLFSEHTFSVMGLACMMSERIAKRLLLANSRRSTAAMLGVSADLITFVLEDKDLAEFIVDGEAARRAARLACQRSAGAQEFLGLRRLKTPSYAADEAMVKRKRAAPGSRLVSLCAPRCPWKLMVSEEACNQRATSLSLADEEEGNEVHCEAVSRMPLPLPSSRTSFPFQEAAPPAPQPCSNSLPCNEAPPAAGHWRLQPDQLHAWSLLRMEVCEALLLHTGQKEGKKRTAFEMCKPLLYLNPLGELYCLDVFRTCKQKAALFAADVMGQFVMVAVFFQGAGMAQSKRKVSDDMCGGDGEDSFGMRIGRFLVIASASVILAGLPVSILESLTNKGFKKIEGGKGSEVWQRQLRSWRIQERLFWFAAALFIGICAAYLLLFLANISSENYGDFTFAGCLGLIEDILAFPLIVSIGVPTASWLWLHAHSRANRVPAHDIVRQTRESLHNDTNVMLPINAV